MTVYTDELELASGTTADTFGTNGTITLNSKAKRLIGLITLTVDQTFTAAEGSAVRVRYSSDDLGIGNNDCIAGIVNTSGPATNSSGQCAIQEFTPLDIACKGNERIIFDIAPTTTITTARLCIIAVQYADSAMPGGDWSSKWPDIVGIKGGFSVDGTQLTTTETALTAITVPAYAKEIIGCKAIVHKTGAITAGEEVLGFFRLTSTMPDIGVQEYPCNGLGATLGTPVGTGMYHEFVPWIPMSIPTTGKNETITPSMNLRTAVTTANRVAFSLVWR